MSDVVDKRTRSKIMSSIHSKNTKVEWMLRSALSRDGLRYRLHRKTLPGNPDIVFPRQKVAIFVDGDFWHGKNWRKLRPKLKNEFWIEKIKKNRKRDRKANRELENSGWNVLRIWEQELRSDTSNCVKRIKKLLKK